MPLFYPRHKLHTKNPLSVRWGKGEAELIPIAYNSGLVSFADSDHARELLNRRSVSSVIVLLNGVAVDWKCSKQKETALHSTGAEIRALATGMKLTLALRNLLRSIHYQFCAPTPIYEDNRATILCIRNARIGQNVRHLDTLIGWTSDQLHHGHFSVQQC